MATVWLDVRAYFVQSFAIFSRAGPDGSLAGSIELS